jgi:hypothetical protein
MANVLNRATREFLPSVHEPSYPVQDWIINPDMSAVVGYPSKYWVVTGDAVTLMDQAERGAVDAAELVARRDSEAGQLANVEGVVRAFMLIVLDDRNLLAADINDVLTVMRTGTSLADIKTKATNLQDSPIYTEAQLRTAIRNKLGS